jgi:hypothetical protein
MSTKPMTTAKELAWKAYCDGIKRINPDFIHEFTLPELHQRFENWWSDNYGNRDTTKFNPEVNIFVENRRYIQAE